MNHKEKIDLILKNSEIKEKLHKIGIYTCRGPQGPTGPRGTGIKINGTYESIEELEKQHPDGNNGDCYIIKKNLVVWDEDTKTWQQTGSIEGPPGESDTIEIRNTITSEPDTKAQVIETKVENNHILDFIIPQGSKGEKGDIGPRGLPGEKGISETITIDGTKTLEPSEKAQVQDNFENNIHHLTFCIPKGEQGSTGPISECSTEGILFVSYAETDISGVMNIQEKTIIPSNSEYFKLKDKTDIELSAGVYEIAFSGAIEEVDNSHGGIFYVKDDSGQVVMDLSFKLPSGPITQMHFSQNIIFEFKNNVVIQVMAGIIGDSSSSKVKINDVNLLLKKIHTN